MRRLELLVIAACLLSTACATQSGATGSAAADEKPGEDQASAELKEHHRHHHHGGVTQFVMMSLDTLGADDAKRPQVEKIGAALRECLKPAREIEKGISATIADGVAAGAVDASKVDGEIEKLGAASATSKDCSATALNELHALLSPEQRAAVADKVQAHWEVWREANHEAPAGGKEAGGRLAELSEMVALTPDQTEKISAALASAMGSKLPKFDPAKAQAHVQAFATAFSTENFDAKTITENANAGLSVHGTRRLALFYETVTPLLTPEQRTKLADELKEHGNHQNNAVSTK